MGMSFASSSVTYSTLEERNEVFISFRGEDTRNNFTSHLYSALRRKNIRTYIDEENLERGDEIAPALLKAIEESKVSVVVFSANYADSSWCLDELVHILECRERKGQKVVPIFYDIDPSHVGKQQGKYAVAFAKLGKRFEDKMDKVLSWKAALTKAASLAGWSSHELRLESKLVDTIVEDILEKLNAATYYHDNFKSLVGIEKRILQIAPFLDIGSFSVRIIGIWGMGGIGKTTLAHALFTRLSSSFEGCCFLANVREESKKSSGPYNLEKKIFSDLFSDQSITSVNSFLKVRLRRKKVLIVLDDVDDPEQLEVLVGDHSYFGPKSRIIVTSRDRQVLQGGVDEIYQVHGLNSNEALELFYSNAFKKSSPTPYCKELSQQVVDYAKGNPLALKVFGSFLCGREPEKWGSALKKLKKVPKQKVQNMLRISYDGLDRMGKDIFLDIACIFKGMDKDYVERVLDGCGLYANLGIDDLVDKSLITISKNRVLMHDLVQELGWEIIYEESTKEPGMRSRIWDAQDVYHILKNNSGTINVEGLFLNTGEIRELHLSPTIFLKMYKLRLLKIYDGSNKYKLYFPQGLQTLPDELRLLYWDKYPLKSLPSNFSPHNLVELDMSESKVEQLWNGVQDLLNLRSINLSGSRQLTQIPDLSRAPNIEIANFRHCKNLLEVPSFQHLEKLSKLRFYGCSSLKKFPMLPRSLKWLCLGFTAIEHFDSSAIDSLSSLEHFQLNGCNRLKYLPSSIMLKSVGNFNLSGCSELKKFPEILEPMPYLTFLFLEGTRIMVLPSSIENLIKLTMLHLSHCEDLEFLPKSIRNLNSLTKLLIDFCPKLRYLPELPASVRYLDAKCCKSLEMVSSSITSYEHNWDDYNCQEQFVFKDCLMLDQEARNNIMLDAQFRILRMAIIMSKYHLEPYDDSRSEICWPTNKIPTWFSYQSGGSSMSIELPRDCFSNKEFIGVAFCTIVDFMFFHSEHYEICCRSHFVAPNGDTMIWEHSWYGNFCYYVPGGIQSIIMKSSHAFLVFDGSYGEFLKAIEEKYGVNWNNSNTTFSFDFSFLNGNGRPGGFEVKKCGVHFLFAQDAEKFHINIGQSPKRRPSSICYGES